MVKHLVWAAALWTVASLAAAEEGSWIFQPSCYSHSPATGARVAQYQPEKPAYLRDDDTYMESGYRHMESTLQVGNSSDHLHVVQTWGQGDLIRPYGEWEFPYRPGATPYNPWPYGGRGPSGHSYNAAQGGYGGLGPFPPLQGTLNAFPQMPMGQLATPWPQANPWPQVISEPQTPAAVGPTVPAPPEPER